MKNKKHIVFLRNPEEAPAWGGLEKLMLDWFKRIDFNKCSVTLAVYSHWVTIFEDHFKNENLPIKVVALPYGHKQGSTFKRFSKLFFFLHHLKPSSVIFVQGWLFSFNLAEVFAGYLASLSKVYIHDNSGPITPSPKVSKRYFGVIEGVGFWWYIQIYLAKWRACLSKNYVVVSHDIKEKLVSMWHYPTHKVLVKHHGIDFIEFHPCQDTRLQMRRNLNISNEEIVIIIASRLSKIKCIDRSLKAFNLLSAQIPQATLLITGQGPLENDLKILANGMPCVNKIKFLGHVHNVADYLKMSDIYVLSSDNEGLSIALIEAIATGLICVSTDCPGVNEILHDGANGFVVEKTTEGVLNGMQKAIKLSTAQKQEMQQRAIHFVSQEFEINTRTKDVFDVFGIESTVSI